MNRLARALAAAFPPAANPCPPGPFGRVFLFVIPRAPNPAAAAPGLAAPAVPTVPFRITSYAAGRINDRAQINFMGQAQMGSSVQVVVAGPDGFTQTQTVTADANGKWGADFTNLPPGTNYRVTATNGNTSLSKTVITR